MSSTYITSRVFARLQGVSSRSTLRSNTIARNIRLHCRHQHQQATSSVTTSSGTISSSSVNSAKSKATSSSPQAAAGASSSSTSSSSASSSKSAAKSIWQRLGPIARALEAYGRAHKKNPRTVQIASAMFIFVCGDIGSQRISGKEFDPTRLARSAVIGAGIAIPQYKWFYFLSTHFNFSSRALSLVTKIAVNQLVFTPLFGTYFFASHALLSGDSFEATIDRVVRFVPLSFYNALKLWPAVMAVNLTYVPLEFRSIFAGVAAIGWQTYLSYLNRLAEEREREMVEVVAAQVAAVEKGAVAAAVAS